MDQITLPFLRLNRPVLPLLPSDLGPPELLDAAIGVVTRDADRLAFSVRRSGVPYACHVHVSAETVAAAKAFLAAQEAFRTHLVAAANRG